MKKLLIVAALAAASIAPAHAISHAYRAQLEREHKTQQSEIAQAGPAQYKPGKLKPIHIKKNGIDFKRSADGFAYLDGHAMAVDEDNEYATVYSSGLMQVTVYKKNNRINAIEDGKEIIHLR